ncbi:MAG: ABC transporter ATP-binding protein [Nitrospiraceae bacterium]|nr:ABC transporter ATP-binding protein [Nitrospiraceae bacterium]
MDAIRVSNLVKSYRSTVAVDGLSLAVPAGSIFGFLGPNGAGKSTTIGCITGLLTPESGQIEILGQRLAGDEIDLKRRIGAMPETLGLFEPLYAHEYLAFVARMFGIEEPQARRRAMDLLDALELGDHAKRLSEYSAGMRKRVAFAAAVIHSPDILFLDEPFESIDPAGVALMKSWLRQFAQRGRTVFITSHVLETVERICTDVAIVIRPGKVVWQGDITALETGGAIRHLGEEFSSLEDLYLHLTGRRQASIEWL